MIVRDVVFKSLSDDFQQSANKVDFILKRVYIETLDQKFTL